SELNRVNLQIENFKKGFPFLKLETPATAEDVIIVLDQKEIDTLIALYDKNSLQKQIVKFVPASGAASRMFKLLFEFLDNPDNKELVDEALNKSNDLQSIKTFFDRISDFAFSDDLGTHLQKRRKKSLNSCLANQDYSVILKGLLGNKGLSYASSPKGLLKFHTYAQGTRTPAMEHLAEGALYAQSANHIVKIHFTVSPEHKAGFIDHINNATPQFENKYGVTYDISFSEQKSYTDTIAVDPENEPFRNEDDSLLFRPAGHGALIANLNEINADIIFVKNIDNVVPDKLKDETIKYKKLIGGVLFDYQNKIFDYIKDIDTGKNTDDFIKELEDFLKNELCFIISDKYQEFSAKEKIEYLKNKLNRPIRVCGMVKNEGEPGGGPFWAKNNDGSTSLQIVESSQIDLNDNNIAEIVKKSTHFNPVDL
ncbi:MAG: DUF4301 family protein, partial [Cyclobacteriaceae bacterium]|nr:DUF4301 family protein [Cyclobacteriaceae bacterium]